MARLLVPTEQVDATTEEVDDSYSPAEVIGCYDIEPDYNLDERLSIAGHGAYGAESWWVHDHHLRRFLGGATEVLELGSGCGVFTKQHVGDGRQVVVSDISPAQLKRHRQEMRRLDLASSVAEWRIADILALPFADHSFDAVTCLGGALSHVMGSGDIAMAEMARVVRPGGTVMISAVSPNFGERDQGKPGVLACGWDWKYLTYDSRSLGEAMTRHGISPAHFSATSLPRPAGRDFFQAEVERLSQEEFERLALKVGISERSASTLSSWQSDCMRQELSLLEDPAVRARYIAECAKPENIDGTPSFVLGVGKALG